MVCIWTEDSTGGFNFWKQINKYIFDGKLTVETKESNSGFSDAVNELSDSDINNEYFIFFDYPLDNEALVNEYKDLVKAVNNSPLKNNIHICKIICYEYLLLSFKEITQWTLCNKTNTIQNLNTIMSNIRDYHIDIKSITDENCLEYLYGFKRYSTERVLKSLATAVTDKAYWSSKDFGKCWHCDCSDIETTKYCSKCLHNESPHNNGCSKISYMYKNILVENILQDCGLLDYMQSYT
jgi:hypothetical protein